MSFFRADFFSSEAFLILTKTRSRCVQSAEVEGELGSPLDDHHSEVQMQDGMSSNTRDAQSKEGKMRAAEEQDASAPNMQHCWAAIAIIPVYTAYR